MSSSLGLYLHIPFCQSICTYCNFNRGLFDAALSIRYVDALEREILAGGVADARDGVRRRADTVFFGGGTPSILDPKDIARLIRACREAHDLDVDAEITLETNPETVTAERLAAFLGAGVTRVSLGVQSFNDAELVRLGRIHSADRAEQAVRLALAAGFNSVSLDLMLWLPGQSSSSWRQTIDRAIELGTEHLSLYLLELYPNAPLKESMARAIAAPAGSTAEAERAAWAQTPDDEAADMYLDALGALSKAGYEQYEISNVAKPGFWSRHNIKYWQMGAWRGFGCGAHSTVDAQRWKNLASTTEYVERIARGEEVAMDMHMLSIKEQREEALFTGLRLNDGVDRRNFQAAYGVDPWNVHRAVLEPCVLEGLVWTKDARFGLTRRGMLVANEILATFV